MTIISDRQIPHPVTFNHGPRVTREQILEINGQRFVCHYWHDASGNLIKVDSKAAA